MTSVLGLDLSLRATGLAAPAGWTCTIKPKSKGDDRLLEIAREVKLSCPFTLDLVVIEDLPTHAHGAGLTGMVHGAVRLELLREGLRYLTVPPATLKVFACGKGNVGKPDMRMELFKRTGLDIADDNQVDAWFLRALGHQLLGDPLLDLPKTHLRALDKLALDN